MRKKYNTPHRSRVVKTRLSEDEYADFTARLAPYGISQSEFLRQAIRRATIRPVVHVSSVNDELLSAVGKLTAEYGRIESKEPPKKQPIKEVLQDKTDEKKAQRTAPAQEKHRQQDMEL